MESKRQDAVYLARLTEERLEQMLPIFCWAFCVDSEDRARRWFDRAGLQNLRGVTVGDELVAGLAQIPMGQWFGGRCVSMAGIAGVVVDETARGSGVGRHLMRSTLREARASGVPLSTLYPATVTFYRDAGYGLAGARYGHRVPCTALPPGRPSLHVRPGGPEDFDAVQRACRRHAALTSGHLDRGDYIWFKVRSPGEKPARCYLVEEGGEVTGYTFVQEVRTEALSHHYELHVTDLVALTPAAAQSMLTFLRGHRSMATTVVWFGDPVGPAVGLLPDRGFTSAVDDRWMLRVVDLEAALAERGFAPAVGGELHLDVRDEVLEANAGRWVLTVRDGRAEVRRGGRGDVSVSVDALAALYTGYRSAEDLRCMGLLDGADGPVATASSLFAGPVPCMPDIF